MLTISFLIFHTFDSTNIKKMNKNIYYLILIILLSSSCKNEIKKEQTKLKDVSSYVNKDNLRV